jgi:hypothetical protein
MRYYAIFEKVSDASDFNLNTVLFYNSLQIVKNII